MLQETAVPLFVVGPPRSGSTFFTVLLNRHPEVFVTNETRIMSFLFSVWKQASKPSTLLPAHPARKDFVEILERQLKASVLEFYRDRVEKTKVGVPTAPEHFFHRKIGVWGDKNPGYADGAKERGCLEFIYNVFPNAKFIHVVRDPRSSVASYLKLRDVYTRDLAGCIEMWKAHVENVRQFFDQIPETARFTVRHEEISSDKGPELFGSVEEFLGIRHAPNPIQFLKNEMEKRTPYRAPTTPTEKLGQPTYEETLSSSDLAAVKRETKDLRKHLGY